MNEQAIFNAISKTSEKYSLEWNMTSMAIIMARFIAQNGSAKAFEDFLEETAINDIMTTEGQKNK